ncbi:MAG: M15 family metallopeptidase [Chlamydiota bacterium]
MKREIIISFVLITNICFGKSWKEVIEDYKTVLPNTGILQKQYQAYVSSDAPTIVDPRIKEIPICENGEKVVDLRLNSSERILMMQEPNAPFEGPCFNSGLPSASKMRTGLFVKLQKMIEALDSLANDFGYEPQQICIKVFEGLRDLNTQKNLFEKKMKEILQSNPHFTMEMAEQETSKWISPFRNNVPVHSTGAAVDIRLWDSKKENFLDMGVFGVLWGSNENAPTFSENITDEQKRNRLYCLASAETAELTNYVYEYWHFSSQDRYDVYWKNLDECRALYGSI